MAAINRIIFSKLKLANHALIFLMDDIIPLAPLQSSDFFRMGQKVVMLTSREWQGTLGVSRVGSSGWLSQKVMGRGDFCLTSGHMPSLGWVGRK